MHKVNRFFFAKTLKLDPCQPNVLSLVPSLICTFVQMYVQDCALVEIRRFHHSGTKNIVSPTHKRTEGRVPCGALSLLQKDAALQGGFS